MSESKEINKLLSKIIKLLDKNEIRISTNEFIVDGDNLIKKAEKDVDEASKKIQLSFDRIHDKLFNFNNILIAAFLSLSKLPSEQPFFSYWIAILPILNLIYLMLLEKWQMEIYRHLSKRMEWNLTTDVDKYGKMINSQNLRSLLSIITTFGLFIFLAIRILVY